MSRVKLTIATTDYDHFRDFRLGIVSAEGIDHTWLTLGHHEVFARFTFNDEHGIGLRDVHWYQAGANERGRVEKVELDLPKGVKLTRVNDKSLSEMIASGEIDCALIARPPNSFLQGHPDVVRLFPNYLEMEEAYYEQTKVWPIMHIIAIQRRVLDEHPWVARNLYNAFVESKRRSLERLLDPAVSRYPLAWLPTYARKMADLFHGDPFFLTASRRTGRRWSSF